MSFEKPPGLTNTHPTEYECVSGSSKIVRIRTDPGFFVRALVTIPLPLRSQEIVAISDNEKVIPQTAMSIRGVDPAEVTFCATARADPIGTTTKIKVGVADPPPIGMRPQ